MDIVKVNICVSKRAGSEGVSADSDGGNGTDGIEDLKEQCLIDLWREVPDIERRAGDGSGLVDVGLCVHSGE